MSTDTGTSAPLQHYPTIKEAPRSTDAEWVADTRTTAAPDQEYPQIVEAERPTHHICPMCKRAL